MGLEALGHSSEAQNCLTQPGQEEHPLEVPLGRSSSLAATDTSAFPGPLLASWASLAGTDLSLFDLCINSKTRTCSVGKDWVCVLTVGFQLTATLKR